MSRAIFALLVGLALQACDDEPGFMAPGLGDFVQGTTPGTGEVLSADKFGRGGIAVFLNFFPAEGKFGFGSLLSFRVDGSDVRQDVEVFTEGGPPPTTATLSYAQREIAEGRHTVEVEYADSRGVVHRIRWDFTISSG